MTGAARRAEDLHPVVRRAGEDGVLPGWARADERRQAHMERVASLLEEWARAREEPPGEVVRWRSVGFLHDALRDAPPEALRSGLNGERATWPAPLLHGPAAAARLRSEGVEDEALLRAVAYHTVGHPDFQTLGRTLYCADYLEPGRDFRNEWRRALRARMPPELLRVTREVVAARVGYLLDRERHIFPLTIRFWNRLLDEGGI